MKTHKLPWWLLLPFLFIAGCTKDHPTKPDPGNGPIARATIGSEGGRLETDGFTLDVPAGAFTDPADLRLSVLPVPLHFASNEVSRNFQVTGLPEDFAEPITLKIRYDQALSGVSLIVRSKPVYLPELDTTVTAESYHLAKDTANALICALNPTRTGQFGSTLSKGGMVDYLVNTFLALSGYDTVYGFYTSRMIHPKLLDEDLCRNVLATSAVCQLLLEQMELPIISREEWYTFFVRDFEEFTDDYAQYSFYINAVPDPARKDYCEIMINQAKMTQQNRQSLCRQVAREFFYMVPEALYSGQAEKYLYPERLWLHSAIGSWFEEKLPPENSRYVPTGFPGNELSALDGPLSPAYCDRGLRTALEHGWGLTPLVKYLVVNYRESVIYRIYEELKKFVPPAVAIENSVADPPSVWWPDFLREYLIGEIYGVTAQTFLSAVKGSFTVSTGRDTLATFPNNLHGLSANLFLVNLDFADISPDAELQFTVKPVLPEHRADMQVMVFGLSQGRLTYWIHGDTVNIANIREVTQSGTDLLAVVSCSKIPILFPDENAFNDLKVRVVKPPQFTRSRIKVRTDCEITWYDGSSSGDEFLYIEDSWRDVTYSNGAFHGGWNESSGSWSSEGTMTVRVDLNSDPIRVTFFEVNETVSSGDETESWSIVSKSNISIIGQPSWGDEVIFRVNGFEACSSLASLADEMTNTSGYSRRLSDFSCNADSYIEIILE